MLHLTLTVSRCGLGLPQFFAGRRISSQAADLPIATEFPTFTEFDKMTDD